MSSTKNRHHTVVVSQDDTGVITGLMLQKDWYSPDFAALYDYHVREERPQGVFHFVGLGFSVTPVQVKVFTDNILSGKLKTLNLNETNTLLKASLNGRERR